MLMEDTGMASDHSDNGILFFPACKCGAPGSLLVRMHPPIHMGCWHRQIPYTYIVSSDLHSSSYPKKVLVLPAYGLCTHLSRVGLIDKLKITEIGWWQSRTKVTSPGLKHRLPACPMLCCCCYLSCALVVRKAGLSHSFSVSFCGEEDRGFGELEFGFLSVNVELNLPLG